MHVTFDNFYFTNRNYTTSGTTKMSFEDAQKFCYDQNTQGLVVWDSEEKYNDVFFVVGISGEDISAWTALNNQDGVTCNSANHCSNKLVRLLFTPITFTIMHIL